MLAVAVAVVAVKELTIQGAWIRVHVLQRSTPLRRAEAAVVALCTSTLYGVK